MPKKGHTEEQIIAALKQHEGGDIRRVAAFEQDASPRGGFIFLCQKQRAAAAPL
jgi:hypothetical protein